VAIYILTLLATTDKEWLSSDYIAGSININPVLVRKEIGKLREFGLVNSKVGKNGGSRLARNSSAITISEIYRAIHSAPFLGQVKNNPNPDCPVGRQFRNHLDKLYREAEDALIMRFDKITLQDFCMQFR